MLTLLYVAMLVLAKARMKCYGQRSKLNFKILLLWRLLPSLVIHGSM